MAFSAQVVAKPLNMMVMLTAPSAGGATVCGTTVCDEPCAVHQHVAVMTFELQHTPAVENSVRCSTKPAVQNCQSCKSRGSCVSRFVCPSPRRVY